MLLRLLALASTLLMPVLAHAQQVEPPEGLTESPDFPTLLLLAAVAVVVAGLGIFLWRMKRRGRR